MNVTKLTPTSKIQKGLVEKFKWIVTRHKVEKSAFVRQINLNTRNVASGRGPASVGSNRNISRVSRGIASVIITIEQKENLKSRVELMNTRINGMTFKSDVNNVGVSDYWASPLETLKNNSGDCEDLSILKLFTLREQFKLPAKDLYLAMAHDHKKNEKHAFSIVNIKGKMWVLDNQLSMRPLSSVKNRYRIEYVFQLSDWTN